MENEIERTDDKRHYFLREDFDELMALAPLADVPDPNDRNSSVALSYPKSIEGAFRELRFRGFKVDAADLMRLVEEKIVVPDGSLSSQEWDKQHIDAAAEWLYDHEQWNSWTHYCWVNNLRYGQCLKAHRAAGVKYGLPMSMSWDAIGLNSTIESPEDPNDYAFVRFFPRGTELGPNGANQ